MTSNFNFNAPVGQVITGDQTIYGDNIGTQNNYHSTAPDIEKLATELDDLLQTIEPQIPEPTTPTGKEQLITAAITAIENKPSLKDRLAAALQAGTFEAIKQFTKNPYVEIVLAAFKAALEAKQKSNI